MGERPLCVSTCLQTFKKHPTCVRFWWSWKVKIHFLSLTSMFSLTSPEVWVQCLICQSLSYFTSSHTQSHLEGEKMCVCVCDKLPCDWHYSRLSHYVTTHFLFPLSLFFVSVFMSLCVTKCLIRVMAAWGGKFPLWFRKYNSTNNIPSDKSHPACAEVCVCLRLWVQPMHVSVTTCLCMLILYLQKYRQ